MDPHQKVTKASQRESSAPVSEHSKKASAIREVVRRGEGKIIIIPEFQYDDFVEAQKAEKGRIQAMCADMEQAMAALNLQSG